MKPMIFSGEMVRALLDGAKTQTRRVIKPQPDQEPFPPPSLARRGPDGVLINCPYGQPGDLLWVRETFACVRRDSFDAAWTGPLSEMPDDHEIVYRASDTDIIPPGVWRSPIYMPRWASRITLRLTDVRVQRMQDINDEDAECEGVEPATPPEATGAHYRPAFQRLWDSINAKRGYGWDTNPWVWALTFEVMQANVEDVWRGER